MFDAEFALETAYKPLRPLASYGLPLTTERGVGDGRIS